MLNPDEAVNTVPVAVALGDAFVPVVAVTRTAHTLIGVAFLSSIAKNRPYIFIGKKRFVCPPTLAVSVVGPNSVAEEELSVKFV